MKKFDSVSIYTRALEKLSQNPNWKAVVNDSVVSSIIKTISEQQAELARYMEYMFSEKWDTARNLSSIIASAGQLGYKPARKKSAFGELYISADPRIHTVGRTLSKDQFLNGNFIKSIPTDIPLNSKVVITDSKQTSYVLTSRNSLSAGSPYVVNSIIQGTKKIISIPVSIARTMSARSKMDPYIYIPVYIENCENAGTSITQQFFRVYVTYAAGYQEEYRVVDSLHLSQSQDRDVEVYPDLYNINLLYLKFNVSPNRGKTLNLSESSGVESIDIHYIETLGSAGNLDKAFETFVISDIPGFPNTKLYGINLEPLIGGTDEETVNDIKRNAPLYYMSTYTAATQEAYEALIKRIDFGNGQYATRVRVFPGYITDSETNISRTVTYVTLLLPGLEDIIGNSETAADTYKRIERNLNFYLMKLKAPTDVLKFYPPNYVSIGIGAQCTVQRNLVENIQELQDGIQNQLNTLYGSNSTELDFGRPFYEADVIKVIKEYSPAILSVKTEIEATKKLDWASVVRMHPISSSPLYTARLNFSFNPIFLGSNYIKGFKDFRTGASYAIRFDIMYKKPLKSSLPEYHTSIFVEENLSRKALGFYTIKDISTSPIWDKNLISNMDYFINDSTNYEELPNAYQFYYKPAIFSDDMFRKQISPENLKIEKILTDYNENPGTLSSYFISFSGDTNSLDGKIGDGFIEFDITSIYAVLQRYAEQDTILRGLLQEHPLSLIKCSTAGDVFNSFIQKVLSQYVDIYVSVRPIDKDLIPSEDDTTQNSIVLYADTMDADAYVTTNLSSLKKKRNLSIGCELV